MTGNISSSYRARAPRDLSTADPASAATVLQAAASDPALARVLDLLARIEPAWIWFDLWRIWEWLQARHPDGQAFVAWVNDDQARWDFRRSANDRALSGEAARHDTGNHEPRGRPISPEQALEFITGLVIRWIQEATGKTLQRSC